jgi:hypothetical protein
MMKNLITKTLAFGSLMLLVLASCKKDGDVVTTNLATATPSALTASASSPVLNSAKLTDPTIIETFTFTQPSFGYSAAVTNTLQLDAPGDNWANPYTVAFGTNVLTQGYNTNDFNAILLKMGLKGGVTVTVNARIQSALSATAFVYSNVLPLTVTPFNLKSWLYVAGSYEGWNNPGPQEDSLYSATSNGIYVGIINFPAGKNDFLVLPAKNWNNKYATNDPTTGTSSTVTYNGPNNFFAPAVVAPALSANYLITLNLNTNKISFALVDYYSIIGDAAQGWSTDVAMKYINDGNSNWSVTLPLLSSGQFKIRQDNAWTYSWGIPNTGSAGFGVANTLNNTANSNIPVAANGNYTVTFNAPITLIGASPATPPPVTTTYSVK